MPVRNISREKQSSCTSLPSGPKSSIASCSPHAPTRIHSNVVLDWVSVAVCLASSPQAASEPLENLKESLLLYLLPFPTNVPAPPFHTPSLWPKTPKVNVSIDLLVMPQEMQQGTKGSKAPHEVHRLQKVACICGGSLLHHLLPWVTGTADHQAPAEPSILDFHLMKQATLF